MKTIDNSIFDFYPAPWTGPVRVPAVNITNMACFPTSKSQATAQVSKLVRKGVRGIRMHKLDAVLRKYGRNYDYMMSMRDRGQLFLDACRRQRVAVAIEFATKDGFNLAELAAGRLDEWAEYADLVCGMDLSAVAYAELVNEPMATSAEVFQQQYEIVRKCGFRAPLAGSNPQFNIPGGYGDLETINYYVDHPVEKSDGRVQFKETYHNVTFLDKAIRRTDLRFVCSELGANLHPSPSRGESERQAIDHLVGLGCQFIAMFAYATNEGHWLSSAAPNLYAFAGDVVRMDTLQYLACAMQPEKLEGLEFVPGTGIPGYLARRLDAYTLVEA